MKVQINQVEGTTGKKGSKQNKVYTLVSNSGTWTDHKGEAHDLSHFWQAVDENGKEFTIYDINRNWTIIGIQRKGVYRFSYTTNFSIIQ